MDVERLKEGGIVSIRDYLLDLQAKGQKIARTESGDPSFAVSEGVKEAMRTALLKDRTHYTAGAGIDELRQAAFDKLRAENGLHLDSWKQVVITSGAMNALYVVFQAIAQASAGRRRMLVPTPTWTETVDNVVLAGMEPVYYSLPLDLGEVRAKLDGVAGIVINTPHNPTGDVVPGAVLGELAALCAQEDLYLVADEAYEHIVYAPARHVSVGGLSDHPKVVSIYSCSKSYAMSGLRVGYFATRDKEVLRHASKMVRCTINGVNSVAQWGAVEAIRRTTPEDFDRMRAVYTERRAKLMDALERCSLVTPVLPQGAFYIWCTINDPETSGWKMTGDLLEKGVGSAPGEVFGPGGRGGIRFSFSCDTAYIDTAREILAQL